MAADRGTVGSAKVGPHLAVLGLLVAGVTVAVLFSLRHSDASVRPAELPTRAEANGASRRAPVVDKSMPAVSPAAREHAEAVAPENPFTWMEPSGDPPKSGPERLEWLRLQFGHTNAALTLVDYQIQFLGELASPTAEKKRSEEHTS